MENMLGTFKEFEDDKYMLGKLIYAEKKRKIIKEQYKYYRTKKQLIKAITIALAENENIDAIGILMVSPKSE